MKNEEEIERIMNQEKKVSNLKTYLWVLFFLISAVLIIVIISTLKDYAGDKTSATKMLVAYIIYALLLIAGFFYDMKLSKKLDKLWEQRKTFF